MWGQHNKFCKEKMKKSINIQKTKLGQKYFSIFELKTKKHDGEVVVYDRYLTREGAEKDQEFIYDKMDKIYSCAWILEQLVWC